MSPPMFQGRRRRRAVVVVAGLLAAGLAGPAAAVVGGQDGGALAPSTIMVLSSRGGVCSGVVVAPDVVLTAAHCVAGAPDHRVHYRSASGEPVLLEPATLTVHPGYDGAAVANRRRSIDLALIRIGEPLPATFVPAALSSAATVAKDAAVTFSGYGVAREGDARSTGAFRTAALAAIEPYGPSRILLWAADPRRAGAGACTGDSGGPVAADGHVVAVASWATGRGRAACGDVSQAVLLAPQREWIDRTLTAWDRRATWR